MSYFTTTSFRYTNEESNKLRQDLYRAFVYPTGDMADPGHDIYEKNIREWLPEMLGKLSRPDIVAVFRVVERLVSNDVDDCFWTFIEEQLERWN